MNRHQRIRTETLDQMAHDPILTGQNVAGDQRLITAILGDQTARVAQIQRESLQKQAEDVRSLELEAAEHDEAETLRWHR